MNGFSFTTSQQIICSRGASSNMADVLTGRNIKSVIIITDPGLMRLGLLDEACKNLQANGIAIQVFSDVEADPSEQVVLDAVTQTLSSKSELVIGFGGGSSLDVAKLVALLAHSENIQPISAIYGVDQIKGTRLPLILIPTTAGTGSEVTPVAIVTTGQNSKMGVVSQVLIPDIAILDAELTLGLPAHITAATGIDAMVHAIEAFTSNLKKNPMSDLKAKGALQLLASNIHKATHCGDDIEARENMLLGALYAGQAFANAPVAAVHALAYPLGGHFHIPHGLSNSLVLPHVLRFNQTKAAHLYRELASVIFPDESFSGSDIEVSNQLIDKLCLLITDLGLPTRLKQMNIERDDLPKLAEDAMLQTRLLVNNPREVTYDDALAIYMAAY